MLATFIQARGLFQLWDGDRLHWSAWTYAGRGEGMNNPLQESRKDFGPLPAGLYSVRQRSHPRFRDPAFALIPDRHEMFGRGGFWIHGGTVSHGCILLSLEGRRLVSSCHVEELLVVHHQIAAGVDLISDAQLTPKSGVR